MDRLTVLKIDSMISATPKLNKYVVTQNAAFVILKCDFLGEYAMLEHENVPGVVESLKITTAANTKRLVHYAFQYAEKHGRKKVTLVHKAVSTTMYHFFLNLQNNTYTYKGSWLHTYYN